MKSDGCHNNCLAGYYPDKDERFCKQCDTSCESCDGGYA